MGRSVAPDERSDIRGQPLAVPQSRIALRSMRATCCRRLLQAQRQSAQIQADDQAVLLAGERQHGDLLSSQNDR
jgi:hypothetical protein